MQNFILNNDKKDYFDLDKNTTPVNNLNMNMMTTLKEDEHLYNN